MTNYGLMKSGIVLIWRGATFWQNIYLLSDQKSIGLWDVILLVILCRSVFHSMSAGWGQFSESEFIIEILRTKFLRIY